MIRCLLTLLVLCLATPVWAREQAPDFVLTGQIVGGDHQTYKPVSFDVPDGVTRLTVAFDYTGRDQKTVIDLGLMDPHRFRGWSGGNKRTFTLGVEDATMSYLPGPLPAGRWTLLLGVPNTRAETVASFEARIFLERTPGGPSLAAKPLKAGAGWYRGDLHAHTGHSDGSCQTQSGARAPCPVYRTAEAATARGLDFIAITDHNTTSHFAAMAQLQPAFDRLLLIPGREVTTFHGHANVFGPTAFIDFRLGDAAVPNVRTLQSLAEGAGGFLSINHPTALSGEACMGCGWTAPDTDYARVGAIEVANGGSERAQGGAEGPLLGVAFWEAQLNAGHRITAIGGSDNHDAGLSSDIASSIGRPTTVVHAPELSTTGLLAGLRAGRVFIDFDGSRDRLLDLSARTARSTATMGGALAARRGETVIFTATVAGADQARLEIVQDGEKRAPVFTRPGVFSIRMGDRPSWVRVNLRDTDGRLLAIGNPIYLSPAP
ncbi:MAG: phosphotransferase [Caulobacter sp. 32-67-35]|nr:MAG: phosphotransferase [Caulobacter sp. 32-67-35]OZA75100.1 MAG: phosphotransferase [Caulobacter sp. 39-67-4]HQR89518.1 CehA/McbA family metallohydrolase [Caulobacter sp.]